MFSRQLFIIILMIFGMSVHAETEENFIELTHQGTVLIDSYKEEVQNDWGLGDFKALNPTSIFNALLKHPQRYANLSQHRRILSQHRRNLSQHHQNLSQKKEWGYHDISKMY